MSRDECEFFRTLRPVELPRSRTCESCGTLDVTIYVPNYQQGGRRLCDRLRRREAPAGG